MLHSSNQFVDQHQNMQNPARLNEEQHDFAVSGSTSQAYLDSIGHNGVINAGDWQEEVYQKIVSMKDLYYADLNDMHQKISIKLQLPNIELLEKFKLFKQMLEKVMHFLQTEKNGILPLHRDKLPSFEKQVVFLVNRCRKPMPPTEHGFASHLPTMQHHQQSCSQNTGPNFLPLHSAQGSKYPLDPVEFPMMDGGDQLYQLLHMDVNYEKPSQADPPLPMNGEDWRTNLLPDSRQRIVQKILDTLRRHLPVYGEEGYQELRKIAIRFEEKIYSAATSQSDYLRKISLKMLTMERKSQASPGSSSYPPFPSSITQPTFGPSHSNSRERELEETAGKIEQNIRAAVISQPDYIRRMSILKDALDKFKSQSILHNAQPSNSTGVSGDVPKLERTHG